ncbi:MAG: NAD(P)-dependent oxidoreductase [Planctomycetota bacterium]
MRILITGGTGFIGCYFVNELLSLGHSINVLDLHPFEEGAHGIDPKTIVDDDRVRFFQGDVRDAETVREAIHECQAVLHLAAAHHDFGISEKTFDEVNIGAAQILCDAMDAVGIKQICFFSTVAVYGETEPPVDEDAQLDAISPYGKTKLGGEQIFQTWAEADSSRRCLTIRPTVTFGVGNFANMFTLIKQIESGMFLPVGDGKNIKSLSYVENIIDATVRQWLDQPVDEPYKVYNYVCKPDLTSREIADIVYKALGKKTPSFRVPYLLARALALPMDLVIGVTGKNLPISGARIRKLAKAQTQYESDRIRDDGYQQRVTLEEGIQRMVQWYLDRGKEEAKQGVKRRLPPERS